MGLIEVCFFMHAALGWQLGGGGGPHPRHKGSGARRLSAAATVLLRRTGARRQSDWLHPEGCNQGQTGWPADWQTTEMGMRNLRMFRFVTNAAVAQL
jgi:hypothetical protein